MPSVIGQNLSPMEKQKVVGEPSTFICTVCGDGFAQYQYVLSHMSIHGPLDSFTFDGSSNGFEVPREYVLQDNGTLTVLNGLTQNEYSKRPSSPGILPSHLSCLVNSISTSPKQQSSPRDVLTSNPFDFNFDNSHRDLHCCEVCGRTFRNLQCLHRHQRYRNAEGGYRCTLCCKFFKGRLELKKHIQHHTFECFQSCASCGKRFLKADALNTHMTQSHSSISSFDVSGNNQDFKIERTYTCKKCKLTFVWLSDFQIHSFYLCRGKKVSAAFETQASPKVTKDNLRNCNGTSTHPQNAEVPNLNASLETDSTYRCGLCGEQFLELNALKKHHTTHEKKAEKPTQDNITSKGFKNLIGKENGNLRKNVMTVKKLKVYPCKFCRRVFRHSSSLSRHTHYHKSITCELCGQRFQQQNEAMKHLLFHKTEMKKQYVSQALSSDHEKHSPGERKGACRNYQCLECGKNFGLLCVYRMHLRCHKKEEAKNVNFTSENENPCLDKSKETTTTDVPVLESHTEDMRGTATVEPALESHTEEMRGTRTMEPVLESHTEDMRGSPSVESLLESHTEDTGGAPTAEPLLESHTEDIGGAPTAEPLLESHTEDIGGAPTAEPLLESHTEDIGGAPTSEPLLESHTEDIGGAPTVEPLLESHTEDMEGTPAVEPLLESHTEDSRVYDVFNAPNDKGSSPEPIS